MQLRTCAARADGADGADGESLERALLQANKRLHCLEVWKPGRDMQKQQSDVMQPGFVPSGIGWLGNGSQQLLPGCITSLKIRGSTTVACRGAYRRGRFADAGRRSIDRMGQLQVLNGDGRIGSVFGPESRSRYRTQLAITGGWLNKADSQVLDLVWLLLCKYLYPRHP